MPCDLGPSTPIRFGLVLLLLAATAGPARSQQEPDRPAAQAQPPANPIDRWNRMSPEERERELAKLPPARARQIRQRIWWYNHMRPEELQELRERYQTFTQLPPDKQQIVRERLREFRQLPAARQPVVHRAVEQLRLLPEAQRLARLNADQFRGQFSPQEQQIIRDLTTYLPH
jgi:flagellar motor protein MotB